MTLQPWIKKIRKDLSKLPKGQWFQGGFNVNSDILVGDRRVARCCDYQVSTWVRESKTEMERALRIIEYMADWRSDPEAIVDSEEIEEIFALNEKELDSQDN